MEEEDEQELEYGRRKRKVTFMPSPGRQNFPLGFSVSLERNFFFNARHHTYHILPRPLVKGGGALDHGTSQNG
jgi:hypothetical protein